MAEVYLNDGVTVHHLSKIGFDFGMMFLSSFFGGAPMIRTATRTDSNGAIVSSCVAPDRAECVLVDGFLYKTNCFIYFPPASHTPYEVYNFFNNPCTIINYEDIEIVWWTMQQNFRKAIDEGLNNIVLPNYDKLTKGATATILNALDTCEQYQNKWSCYIEY